MVDLREYLIRLSQECADKGKLIEAGWLSLRAVAIPPEASATQLRVMREAFFAGAQHLFGSIMSIMDPGTEPTENDMRRMDLINKELNEFAAKFSADHGVKTPPTH